MNKHLCCIRNGKIVLENKVLTGKSLIFSDKIIDIVDGESFDGTTQASGIETIDAHENYVSPGFIDIHIHGSGGKDTMDGAVSDLAVISRTVARNGVTGFLPTTMSMEEEKIRRALDAIRIAMKEPPAGAKILGAHMEGPFISGKYKGAHSEEHLMKPDATFIRNFLDIIRIITIAPEEDFEFQFIKSTKAHSDAVLSIGHTNADYETAMEAIGAGVSSATHIFNAMPPFHHRAPGVIGAILRSDIYFELIADTLHVHPAVFQILLNAKGKDRMILVTDAMRAGSMEAGSWELGGQEVTVDDHSARLRDGTLAGSILTLNKAVLNILKHTDLEIHEAVALASLNPARLLGADQEKGSIKIGKDADIVIFDDELNVQMTFLGGESIYGFDRG